MDYDIAEPTITRENILFLDDPAFNSDNVCLVTGAAGGIGRASAVVAAANGLTVFGIDLNKEGLEETRAMAEELGGRMICRAADLTVDEELESCVEAAANEGDIKYLLNIGGVQHIDFIEDFPMERFDFMQRLMVRAPFYLSKLCLPHMKANPDGRGVVGNMASIHAHICTVAKTSYNITKFSLKALAQSISAEGGGKVRGFTVSTGFVKTALALNQIPAQAEARGISPEEVVREVMMGHSRVKEMMTPAEVGNIFIFGLSRFADYLVGGDLLFDGGVVLTYAQK